MQPGRSIWGEVKGVNIMSSAPFVHYSVRTDYSRQHYYGDIYLEPTSDVASDSVWQAEKWDSLTRSW